MGSGTSYIDIIFPSSLVGQLAKKHKSVQNIKETLGALKIQESAERKKTSLQGLTLESKLISF